MKTLEEAVKNMVIREKDIEIIKNITNIKNDVKDKITKGFFKKIIVAKLNKDINIEKLSKNKEYKFEIFNPNIMSAYDLINIYDIESEELVYQIKSFSCNLLESIMELKHK